MDMILTYLNNIERQLLIKKIKNNSSKGTHKKGSDQKIRLLKNEIFEYTSFLEKNISLSERLNLIRNNYDIFYHLEITHNNLKKFIEIFLLNIDGKLNSPVFKNTYIKKFLLPVIVDYTKFLPDNVIWSDRWYCIKNDIDNITKLKKCKCCDKYIVTNLLINHPCCSHRCWLKSEEFKISSSITSTGRKQSQETINRQIITRNKTKEKNGYYFSEETKKKMSDKAKGNINFLINGKPWNHKDNLKSEQDKLKWEQILVKVKKIKELKGFKLPDDLYESYKKYRRKVYYFTNKQSIYLLANYDKRGKSGVADTYQLDHKYSIMQGFKDSIPPKIIGNIINLQFIPSHINSGKGQKCNITKEKLYEDYSKQTGENLSEIFSKNS